MHTSQPTATLRRTGGRLAKASPIKSISISVIQKKLCRILGWEKINNTSLKVLLFMEMIE